MVSNSILADHPTSWDPPALSHPPSMFNLIIKLLLLPARLKQQEKTPRCKRKHRYSQNNTPSSQTDRFLPAPPSPLRPPSSTSGAVPLAAAAGVIAGVKITEGNCCTLYQGAAGASETCHCFQSQTVFVCAGFPCPGPPGRLPLPPSLPSPLPPTSPGLNS